MIIIVIMISDLFHLNSIAIINHNHNSMGSSKTLLAQLVFFTGIATSSLLVIAALSVYTDEVNGLVFRKHHLPDTNSKWELVKTLTTWASLFLLTLSTLTMMCRVLSGGKAINPAKGTDPELIQTLNRIIGNTLEQSFIFAGLFGNILFDIDTDSVAHIGDRKVLVLASLFVIGRVVFAVGYLLCFFTGISTWRSFGFPIGLIPNIVMALYHLQYNIFGIVQDYGQQTLNLIH